MCSVVCQLLLENKHLDGVATHTHIAVDGCPVVVLAQGTVVVFEQQLSSSWTQSLMLITMCVRELFIGT